MIALEYVSGGLIEYGNKYRAVLSLSQGLGRHRRYTAPPCPWSSAPKLYPTGLGLCSFLHATMIFIMLCNLAAATALPLSSIDEHAAASECTCNDADHGRTMWNIVWSCVVTIFACTWVAIHPNIPKPQSPTWAVMMERGAITVLALLMPEFILVWAIRQWYAAADIAECCQAAADRAQRLAARNRAGEGDGSTAEEGSVNVNKVAEGGENGTTGKQGISHL